MKHSQKGKMDLLTGRIYFGENQKNEKSSNNLMKIQSAITNFQLLEIEYSSSSNELTRRHIEPFAFYNNKENWILIAFCRLRNEFRAFRIDSIKKLIPRQETFTQHNMTIDQYFEQYVKKK